MSDGHIDDNDNDVDGNERGGSRTMVAACRINIVVVHDNTSTVSQAVYSDARRYIDGCFRRLNRYAITI